MLKPETIESPKRALDSLPLLRLMCLMQRWSTIARGLENEPTQWQGFILL